MRRQRAYSASCPFARHLGFWASHRWTVCNSADEHEEVGFWFSFMQNQSTNKSISILLDKWKGCSKAVSWVKTKSVWAAGGEIKLTLPPVKGFQFAGDSQGPLWTWRLQKQVNPASKNTKNTAHGLTKNSWTPGLGYFGCFRGLGFFFSPCLFVLLLLLLFWFSLAWGFGSFVCFFSFPVS